MGHWVTVAKGFQCKSCSGMLTTDDMFLKGDRALLMCSICGRILITAEKLSCDVSGCGSSPSALIISKYRYVLKPKPIASFCLEHSPQGLKYWLYYSFLKEGKIATPYVPDRCRAGCPNCQKDVWCSNKRWFTKCPECGQVFSRSVSLFGPERLIPCEVRDDILDFLQEREVVRIAGDAPMTSRQEQIEAEEQALRAPLSPGRPGILARLFRRKSGEDFLTTLAEAERRKRRLLPPPQNIAFNYKCECGVYLSVNLKNFNIFGGVEVTCAHCGAVCFVPPEILDHTKYDPSNQGATLRGDYQSLLRFVRHRSRG